MDNQKDIVQEYFELMRPCNAIACQKVIFEPETKREWFFEDDYWCYFEFLCEDKYYKLKKSDTKEFSDDCIVRDMSYEIKMLLAYYRLRGVVTIEKETFDLYIKKYENIKAKYPDITTEKFNLDLRQTEEAALIKSDKIANGIMGGCLILAVAVLFLFLFAIISYFKMHYFS